MNDNCEAKFDSEYKGLRGNSQEIGNKSVSGMSDKEFAEHIDLSLNAIDIEVRKDLSEIVTRGVPDSFLPGAYMLVNDDGTLG